MDAIREIDLMTEVEIETRVADVIVREASDDDSATIIELITDVYSEFHGCVLLVEDEEPELLVPKSSFDHLGGRFWVAECQGRICGTVAITPTDAPGVARLQKLYVSNAARGRGVGEALCRLVERTATEQMNANMLMLYTDSRFLSAHRLYERLGYQRQPGLVHRADASKSIEYVYTKTL